MSYDVDYYIKKFTAIPERKWTTRVLNIAGTDICCALGHCGERIMGTTMESRTLFSMFHKKLGVEVPTVNDGAPITMGYSDVPYLGDTPRERILAALELIKSGVWI